jgi:acyl transferase domain-containing protein/phosphopantetheinyl transferase
MTSPSHPVPQDSSGGKAAMHDVETTHDTFDGRETRRRDGGVAIIGMSCRFPGAPNVDTFWHNILNKVDAISDPPPDTWDSEVYYDPAFLDTDKVYCRRGGYLGSLVSFDPLAHGIPPISVGGEPDQWLALQLAVEAFADANCQNLPDDVRQRTAVILGKGTYLNGGNAIAVERGLVVGQTLEIIRQLMPELGDDQIEALRAEMKQVLPAIGPETVPGLISNIIVGRIANRLDLMGPAYTVDAACASSLLAVQHAVRALRSGEADLVLAGGSQVWIPVPTLNLFCQLGALSRRQQIRPFDADADGTLLGEGIAMIVLKRLADAERDGDRIYAVIRGTGIASDGRGQSVMAPRVDGEELALRRAYEDAGISPRTIGLIEAHGTATPVGDVAEVQALTRVFGKREQGLPWCALGTVKSMISHTIPAAGTAGIIKAALSLHHKVLPPTINCDRPNPKLELETTPFYINPVTRPWIHGADEPRRAGVNAYGFGGINAHVVLEEYGGLPAAEAPETESPERPSISLPNHLSIRASEACVLEASSLDELRADARALMAALEPLTGGHELDRDAPFSLADLAFTLNSEVGRFTNPARLAIVAESLEDLRAKLGKAIPRLEDPECRQIKDVRGIYYSAEPLTRRDPGRIAFLFPGEGSQYPNMMADICLHFPETRTWFDQCDRVVKGHSRGYLTSDFVFPRPAFSEEERRDNEQRLMDMNLAVEAVLTANQAMLTLVRGLGLRPDVCLGHSTGEYSALVAAGVLGLETETALATFSHDLNLLYEDAAARNEVPRAMMLAIGADRAQAAAIAQQAGGNVFLAMDNCPHQAVLVGDIDDVERARGLAHDAGLIYEQLTFDRAYHTPLFAPFAEQLRAAFAETPIQSARIPVYSCTTAMPYPDDPEAVRDLMVEHWASPVQFQSTIERLYQDGVRIFVEVGPRGNLSAFVEDILRGRPMIAVPANTQRRSGMTQLNHLVALLASHGIDLNWEYLAGGRKLRQISWRDGRDTAPNASTSRIQLSTSWPMLRLPDDVSTRINRPAGTQALNERTTAVQDDRTVIPESPSWEDYHDRGITDETSVAVQPPQPVSPDAVPDNYVPYANGAAGQQSYNPAIDDYLDTMDHFLDVQQAVMRGFFATATGSADTSSLPPTDMTFADQGRWHATYVQAERSYPLLGQVTSSTPGVELVTQRIFDPAEDRYLLDHTLGRSISTTDPGLHALAVMPLAMSLEILAEAASCLIPDCVVIGFRNVEARRWIAWDDKPKGLEVTARRAQDDGASVAVDVKMYELDHSGEHPRAEASPVVLATVLLSDGYPAAPNVTLTDVTLGSSVASGLRPEQLYSGVMFHGPAWRGVTAINRTSSIGCSARMRTLPFDAFFASEPAPQFAVDPVTLDSAGQVIGFWTAEHLTNGRVVFPYRVESIDIFGPTLLAGRELSCFAAISLIGDKQMSSTIEVADGTDQLWMRLVGWEDKRFELPSQMEPLLLDASAGTMSMPWLELSGLLGGDALIECRRCSANLSSDREFWKRVWAMRVLNRRERERFQHLRLPERRQLEWLAVRTAAKEGLVRLIRARHGIDLRPADIEIDEDAHGQPLVRGEWLQSIGSRPLVSLSHSDGEAAALAALVEPSARRSFGVDIERVSDRPAGLSDVAFSEAERALLAQLPGAVRPEWELRCWCAKEAAAKATGLGLIDGPGTIELVRLDVERNDLRLRPSKALEQRFPELVAVSLQARTGRDGDIIFAVATLD